MDCSVNILQNIINSPLKKAVIRKARILEAKIRFHSMIYTDMYETNMPTMTFLSWVQTLLPKDKYFAFLSLFKFPLVTIPFVCDVFARLETVFDGKNPKTEYSFTESSLLSDWLQYKKNVLHEPQVWREKGWDVFKWAINSFVVITSDTSKMLEAPEPYFYFLSIDLVLDYRMMGNDISWIVFRDTPLTIQVICDEYYRIYEVDPDDRNSIARLVSETRHSLGYCPVRFFWTDCLNTALPDIKRSPLSPFLYSLDWLLFFSISKKHLDLYAPYPIYSFFKADCDFRNNETGDYCDGGYLRNPSGVYIMLNDGQLQRCPACFNKRLTGVGSTIEIPIPTEGQPDLRNPVQITTIDKDSLEYNVLEIERLQAEIMNGATGKPSDVLDKTSVTDSQIQSSYESRTAALNILKRNFEEIQKFTDDTICKLRYGDSFLGSSISLGTDFYVYTLENLTEKYIKTKENHLNHSELDRLSFDMLQQRYRDNPAVYNRMNMLRQLEPYPHYSFEELMILHEKGLVNTADLKLKIHFSDYIRKFETENTSITEFGANLPIDQRVSIISNKLREYGANIVGMNPQVQLAPGAF